MCVCVFWAVGNAASYLRTFNALLGCQVFTAPFLPAQSQARLVHPCSQPCCYCFSVGASGRTPWRVVSKTLQCPLHTMGMLQALAGSSFVDALPACCITSAACRVAVQVRLLCLSRLLLHCCTPAVPRQYNRLMMCDASHHFMARAQLGTVVRMLDAVCSLG